MNFSGKHSDVNIQHNLFALFWTSAIYGVLLRADDEKITKDEGLPVRTGDILSPD